MLDILPTADVFNRADKEFALGFWVWSFLAAPEPVPEQMIVRAPDIFVNHMLDNWSEVPDAIPPEVRAAYVNQFRSPRTIHAICEEYRAAATIDAALDRQDRAANRRIGCPTLVLWSEGGGLDTWYASAGGPLGLWRRWAADVSGGAIRGGHFFPEQNPQETIAALHAFFAPA